MSDTGLGQYTVHKYSVAISFQAGGHKLTQHGKDRLILGKEKWEVFLNLAKEGSSDFRIPLRCLVVTSSNCLVICLACTCRDCATEFEPRLRMYGPLAFSPLTVTSIVQTCKRDNS